MPISVSCACGHTFRIEGQSVGGEGPCPACQQNVKLEGREVTPFDVFVSHSSVDKAIADAAVAILEQRGLRCWIAPRDVTPGKEWSEAIVEGIEQSSLLLLIFSQHSNASQQVLREVERAVSKGIPILPFRIEKVPARKALGYFISCYHWLDAYHPPLDQHLNRMAELAGHLVLERPAPPPPREKGVADKLTSAVNLLVARDRRILVLAGLTAALLLLAVFIGGLALASRPPKASEKLIAARSAAEGAVQEIRQYDAGDGFGREIQAVETELRTALALYDQKQFAKCEPLFHEVVAASEKLQRREQDRTAAKRARDGLAPARQAAERARAAEFAAVQWQQAVARAQAGEAAYRAGDFVTALTAWNDAARTFQASQQQAATARMPEIKALSYWLGFSTRKIQLYEHNRETLQRVDENTTNLRKPLDFSFDLKNILPKKKLRPVRSDWPPYKAVMEDCREVLEVDCRPHLDLPPELFERFANAADTAARQAVMLDMLAAIERTHGRSSAACFRLGHSLATIRSHCAQGREAMDSSDPDELFRNSNHEPPRPEVTGAMEAALAAAYDAGCTADTVTAIKLVRQELDRVFNGFEKTKGIEADYGYYRAEQQAITVVKTDFANVQATIDYFRDAKPAERKREPALSAEVRRAWKSLEELGAVVTLDLMRDDPPPLGIGFTHPTYGVEPPGKLDVVVEHAAKIPMLKALDLSSTWTTDEQLRSLAPLTQLVRLGLRGTSISDRGLNELADFEDLQWLDLRRTKITDEGIKSLVALPSLSTLQLDDTAVSDAAAESLIRMQELKYLSIERTKIGPSSRAALQKSRPDLQIGEI